MASGVDCMWMAFEDKLTCSEQAWQKLLQTVLVKLMEDLHQMEVISMDSVICMILEQAG